ncbi:uncharacterized protein LOC112451734 [Temnothorax curvispinosus]|uniref:Uncharacterized protein LOC112451734 n=1 Tax=Temnothorax curvispinosus TaxID=300111 RepID=A0A6J1PD48_9HYME|nr:uncharacterized protein LOC112451734 [Temnothorax curvispinosus]
MTRKYSIWHTLTVCGERRSFRIGRSTAHKIIPETCEAIISTLQPIYFPPMTRDMWRNVTDGFWQKCNFPNCIGAVDGKHIRIKAPKNSGSQFFNYKKFFSIVLMAANYVFTWVDLEFYGSMNDGAIWTNSDFGTALEQGTADLPHSEPLPGGVEPFPFSFVGDEAFPLKPYMMRLYAKPKGRRRQNDEALRNEAALDSDEDPVDVDPALQALTMPQRIFNYRLSKARRVIENTFGILVAKWQILAGQICSKVENAESIVMALLCLHNFLIESDLPEAPQHRNYLRPGLIDGEGPNSEPLENGEWRNEVQPGGVLHRVNRVEGLNPARAVIDQRDKLRDFFLTEVGEVIWQYDYAFRNVPIVRGSL